MCLILEFPHSPFISFLLLIAINTAFLTSEALRLVIEAAKPGASVLSLCEKGDVYIMAETGKVFKKEKEMKKGEAKIVKCISCIFDRAEVDPSKKRKKFMKTVIGGLILHTLYYLDLQPRLLKTLNMAEEYKSTDGTSPILV